MNELKMVSGGSDPLPSDLLQKIAQLSTYLGTDVGAMWDAAITAEGATPLTALASITYSLQKEISYSFTLGYAIGTAIDTAFPETMAELTNWVMTGSTADPTATSSSGGTDPLIEYFTGLYDSAISNTDTGDTAESISVTVQWLYETEDGEAYTVNADGSATMVDSPTDDSSATTVDAPTDDSSGDCGGDYSGS